MSKVYELSYSQLRGIANLCYQEQGSVPGAAAEASLMCNLYELRHGSSYGSLYDYVRSCGWWAKAAYWMDNGEASESVMGAVADVIMNGNRTLPEYVDEHDCFSDIESISTGNVYDRSDYIQDVTVIKNCYGSTYTFYCFPAPASDPFGYTTRPTNSEIPAEKAIGANDTIEKAISQMEAWAKDDSHGYDQEFRWGENGDYDCSSAVIQAWELAGVAVKSHGATYTGDMLDIFIGDGFKDVTGLIDLTTGEGLERGDVLLNEQHHVAMYCGDGNEVEARINEDGSARGGEPGDQTGREFLIQSYRNYPWDFVLRFEKGDEGEYEMNLETVQMGSVGASALILQLLLRGWGYKGKDGKALARDGEVGENTVYALKKWQKKRGLDVDGICGSSTWKSLTSPKK